VSNVLPPRSPRSYPFRVYYTPDLREGAGPKAASPLNMRIVADKTTASIDLTSSAGEKRVTQDLEGPYGLKYTERTDSNMVVLNGRRGSGYDLTLTATHNLENIRVYIWRARIPSISTVWTTIAVTNTTSIEEDVFARFLELGGDKAGEVKVDYVVAVSRSKNTVTVNNSDLVSVLSQSNVYEWRATSSNLLLLLLLLPGLAIPAIAGAIIFARTKGANKRPVQELGMASKEKFIAEEMDDEPVQMTELDTPEPLPPTTQSADPVYEAPEPAPEVATSGKQYAIPTGPTYIRGGVPVNVVDN